MPDREDIQPGTGRRLGVLFSLVLVGGVALTLIARRRWWLPPLASAEGAEIDRLITTTLVLTGLICGHGQIALSFESAQSP